MNNLKKTILIVEDSIVQALAVQMMLVKHGVNILRAEDGETGLKLASQIFPDAILLDIELPGINGLEVCRLLRDNKRTLEIPIILLTAHTDLEMLRKGFVGGAIEFIPKDAFYKTVLLETLRQMKIIENDSINHNYQSPLLV
jgi:CheY-like chemotaxis protein